MESALLFIGVAVSLLVQLAKKKLKTTTLGTLLLVVAGTLGAAIAVELVKAYGLFESLIQILATAGAFYAFVIRTMESDDIAKHGLKMVK